MLAGSVVRTSLPRIIQQLLILRICSIQVCFTSQHSFVPLHFATFVFPFVRSFHALHCPTAAHPYGSQHYCQHTFFRLTGHLLSHNLCNGVRQARKSTLHNAVHHPGKLLKATHFPATQAFQPVLSYCLQVSSTSDEYCQQAIRVISGICVRHRPPVGR